MGVVYLHGQQYILPILLLFAVVFVGVPLAIGWAYYRWRNRHDEIARTSGGLKRL